MWIARVSLTQSKTKQRITAEIDDIERGANDLALKC